MQVVYPYDPTASDDLCLIKTRESHSLSSLNNSHRLIVPDYAPFFANDFELSFNGNPLVYGRDYTFGLRYVDVEGVLADAKLYGCIIINNQSLEGDFVIEQYRTIGGNLTYTGREVFNYLINKLIDPIQTTWDKIEDKVTAYPVVLHKHDWSDYVNKQYIAEGVDNVTTSVAEKSTVIDTVIANLTARLDALESLVDNSGMAEHIANLNNPHLSDAQKTDALAANATAVDAFKLYGLTLAELAEYINSTGVTYDTLKGYLSGSGLATRMIIDDTTAKIKSSKTTAELSLANNSFTLTCTRDINLRGNGSLANTIEDAVGLKVSGNLLSIDSNKAVLDKNAGEIAESVIMHAGNYRTWINDITFGELSISATNGTMINVTGTGVTGDELELSLNIPIATDSKEGILYKLSSVTGNRIDATVGSAVLAGFLATLATNNIAKTITVNGIALSADIILTKAHFDLANVDNTADINKPISGPQQSLLDLYSNLGHKHDFSALSLVDGSITTPGVVYLNSTLEISDTRSQATVSPSVLNTINTAVDDLSTITDGYLDLNALRMIAYNHANVTTSGFTLTLDSSGSLVVYGKSMIMKGAAFDLTSYAGTTIPIYLSVDSIASYTLSNLGNVIVIGYAVVGATSITSYVINDVDRTEYLGELIEHLMESDPHGISNINAGNVGLELVENAAQNTTLLQPFEIEKYTSNLSNWDTIVGSANIVHDSSTDTLAVTLTDTSVVKVCNSINMWDHLTTNYEMGSYMGLSDEPKACSILLQHGFGDTFLIGCANGHYITWGIGIDKINISLDSGNGSYTPVTLKTINATFTPGDRFLSEVVFFKNKDTYRIAISMSTNSATNNVIKGYLDLNEITDANAIAAFKSGVIGWRSVGAVNDVKNINWMGFTPNLSTRNYTRSKDLLAALNGHNAIKCISGSISGSSNIIPVPRGVRRGILLLGEHSVGTSTANRFIASMDISVADGADTYTLPGNVSMIFKQVTIGGTDTQNAAINLNTLDYLIIGFRDCCLPVSVVETLESLSFTLSDNATVSDTVSYIFRDYPNLTLGGAAIGEGGIGGSYTDV